MLLKISYVNSLNSQQFIITVISFFHLPDIDESKCSSSGCNITETASCSTNHSHISRTKERVFKLNKRASSPWKPNFLNNRKPCFQKKNNYGIRKCYKCDEPSHKVGNYTFEENTKRVGNILICNNKWFKKIL